MDRSERLTTFEQYPQPSEDEASAIARGELSGGTWPQLRRPEPTSRYSRWALRATRMLMRLLELSINSTIRVQGEHNLGTGPVLFVANHFTRFETFILPWVISNVHGGRLPLSLAFNELFRGRFGDFLMSVGARPTGDPVVKHTIVEDLMTGRNNWLIYPEGSMIKNKKVWESNRLSIDSPDRTGSLHHGAAIMALKAILYRRLYAQACATGNVQLMQRYQARYHLHGPQDISAPDVHVVPVNISYFPLRPRQNILYRTARWLFRQLPRVLEEELLIEGSLLLSRTDISVYFGKPIALDRYVNLVMPTLTAPLPFVDQLRRANRTLGVLKHRLTRRMMHEVYSHLTINIDHLFASGLRALDAAHVPASEADATPQPDHAISCSDFHQALYLAARRIQATGRRRRHPSLGPRLLSLLCDERCHDLESIRTLAVSEGVLKVEKESYRIDHQALAHQHSFHDIRLKNTLAVIANELEPLRSAVRELRNTVQLPPTVLHREVCDLLRREEMEDYRAELKAQRTTGQSCAIEVGRPLVLERPSDLWGIVLCHGYLSAPEEMRPLAEYLHGLGFSVHVPRLPGHGTAPAALDTVTAEDWVRACERAYLAMRNTGRGVMVAGFSAGALIAMRLAARHHEVAGVIAINPCLELADRMSLLVPPVWWANRMLARVGLARLRFAKIANHAENPAINYAQNYVNGIYQLERLINQTIPRLPDVAAPTLIIQGDQDPVTRPHGAARVLAELGSQEKELAMMSFTRHVIVRDQGCEPVLQRAGDFATLIAERCNRHRLEPVTRRVAG